MNAARNADPRSDATDDVFYRVNLADLTLAAYNRVVSDYHVENLVEAFRYRPWAMPAIECNMREDGSLVIINGQHRAEAARRLGWQTIKSIVHFGWTEAAEAQAFRDSARGKGINSLDQWWAAGLAGDPEVLAVNTVLSGLGLFVPRRFGDSHLPGAVACPKALLAVARGHVKGNVRGYGTFDPARVEHVLSFVIAAWPDDTARFDGRLLRILGAWFKKYAGHPSFSTKEAVRKLGVYDAREVITRIQQAAHADSTDITTAGSRVLTGLYDKARRGQRLMPVDKEGDSE